MHGGKSMNEELIYVGCPVLGCDWHSGDWSAEFEAGARKTYEQHWFAAHVPEPPEPCSERWIVRGCENCDGRKCMSCCFREWHDECEDDCPFCCLDIPQPGQPTVDLVVSEQLSAWDRLVRVLARRRM
jgi:hypothetical protein